MKSVIKNFKSVYLPPRIQKYINNEKYRIIWVFKSFSDSSPWLEVLVDSEEAVVSIYQNKVTLYTLISRFITGC